ncbi:hypothetical protein F5880DRAFT_521119 [Lentinula raphanica]|nr:hypothetical protein F5880DRAFT_521119 [Lentinula raphanica]
MGEDAFSRTDASRRNQNNSIPPIHSPSSPALPRSLMPGSPSTVHRPDLFFSTPPRPPVIHNRPLSSRSYSAEKPKSVSHLNRSRTTSPPHTHYDKFVPPPPPPPLQIPSQATPESPTDQVELQTAMQLSKSEIERQRLLSEKLVHQEEDDLARALAESMRIAEETSLSSPGAGPSRPPTVPIHTRPYSKSLSSRSARSSESRQSLPFNEASSTTSDRSKSIEIENHSEPVSWGSPSNNATILDDEALARQLAAEEERERALQQESARISAENAQPSLEDDEAFARQLALQEEEEDKDGEANISSIASSPPPLPPTYSDSLSPPSSTTDSSLLRSDSSVSSTSFISSSESSTARSKQPMRSSSDEAHDSKPAVPIASRPSGKEQLDSERSMGPINVNEFVDKELLRGVCES